MGGVTDTAEGMAMAITLKGQHKNPSAPHDVMRSFSFNSPVKSGPKETVVLYGLTAAGVEFFLTLTKIIGHYAYLIILSLCNVT